MVKHLYGLIMVLACMAVCTGCHTPEPIPTESAAVPSTRQEAPEELRIYVMNIGKADGILIQFRQNTVLIDCGEQEDWEKVQAVLHDRKVRKLDYLILTHLDKDHIGGAAYILREYPVGQVIQSANDESSSEYAAYTQVCLEKEIKPLKLTVPMAVQLSELSMTLLPAQKREYKNDNDYSILTEVAYGSHRFLFAGDAVEKRLNEYLETDHGTFDFLKVPHHGKEESNSGDFFAAVDPAYAVITCSKKNPPDPEVPEMLQKNGAQVFLTYQGPVEAVSDGRTLRVTQYN